MDDDINFDSDGDQEYGYGRQEKRRGFEVDDPMDDDDDLQDVTNDQSRNPSLPRRTAAVAGPSRQAAGREDHEEGDLPSFRPVSPTANRMSPPEFAQHEVSERHSRCLSCTGNRPGYLQGRVDRSRNER